MLDELDKFIGLISDYCEREFRAERFACGKFMAISLGISNVQQHSI